MKEEMQNPIQTKASGMASCWCISEADLQDKKEPLDVNSP